MRSALASLIATGALLAALSFAVRAEDAPYPARPIRLIVPTTPGSPPDLVARLIGEKLTARLGQPVVYENRPGASGIVGLEAVARSKPDGHTLGAIAMPYVVNATLVPHMPYDMEKDLAPVALIDWSYNILVVPSGSAVKSIPDLIAAAKTKPGSLKFSSGGNGTPGHLAGELLKRETGIDIAHIPYKGAAAPVVALLAGDVDMTFGAVGVLSPHLKGGKVHALATPAPHRIAAFPEVPTFAELGYKGIEIRDWQGFVAPAGTPSAIIEHLSSEIAEAASMPDVKARLEVLGMEPAFAGPQPFATHLHDELNRWRALVRDAGIKPD